MNGSLKGSLNGSYNCILEGKGVHLLVEPLLDVGHPLEVGHGGGAVLGRVLQAKETKSMT